MKLKILIATCWDGKRLAVGDTVDVADDVATRWEAAGIAEKLTADGEKAIEKMNTAELTQKAAELGVDISALTTNKQRAEAIQAHIDALAKE